MAGTRFNVVVCCLSLVVLAPLLAQGQILNALNLTSKVCCTPSGNCSPGAAGLANVTGVLSCVNILTGAVMQVGQGISNANGTLTITVTPKDIVGGALVVLSGVVPCVLTDTFALVNQTLCPVINVVNTTIAAVPTVLQIIPSLLTGVITGLLGVTNYVPVPTVNVTVGANIG